MITRPATSIWTFTATAPTTEPTQNTATPASITFLRPKRSPSVPMVSMRLANTRA